MIHFHPPAFRPRERLSPATIGICSLQHNAGTTCLSFACANYLCSKLNQPTALVERNGTHAFRRLHPGKGEHFKSYGIDFYPDAGEFSCSDLSHTWRLFDYGVITDTHMAEFLRCDRRLVLLDLSPWNRELTEELFERAFGSGRNKEQITLLGNPAPTGRLSSSSVFYGRDILTIPYLPNPFHLTPDDFGVFEKIFKGV